MSQLALDLFPGLDLKPTIAQQRAGVMVVNQCAHCGLLVCAPDCGDYRANARLAACPRCEHSGWWHQDLPATPGTHIVGPFYRSEELS